MRVVTNIEGTEHDIPTGEFANGSFGPDKFSDDHQKVLRESKVILYSIVNRKYTSRSDARRLIIPSFQATGLDGELKIMRLVAPGIYTVQYVGSIPIPNHVEDLQQLRKKCFPRLNYMKNQAVKNAKLLAVSVKKETRAKKKQKARLTKDHHTMTAMLKLTRVGREEHGSQIQTPILQ
ncbi:hypothetical protein BDF21DRAFT_393518 [Thamnidium elegans]|nr:hypothetical protein BDF21DRAFT_393518 [Thamnidium elegans]